MYTCGITPYDSAHMGHVFTFLTYDILWRYLEYRGHSVKLVRNVTDVDEPIYRKAAELGVPYTELAAQETTAFQLIMRKLGIRQPAAEPRASEYIDQMAEAVKRMLSSGHAYTLDTRDVYFDVSTYSAFGQLSGFSERLQLGFMKDRGGDPDRKDKRNPLDFLLWKAITDKQDPAAWDSVVGYGRPGWHIECSVMSSELLGTPMDIHGGGMDLIFPHHECENAQSAALGNAVFAKHWMHVAPLGYQGEKMSKSLGNLVFAKDLLETYKPAAIRLALFQYHYRVGGEWHIDALDRAAALLPRLQQAAGQNTGDAPEYRCRAFHAMDNDLYLPEVYGVLEELSDLVLDEHAPGSDLIKELLDLLGLSEEV